VAIIERLCEVLTETEHSYEHWKRLVTDHGVIGTSVHDARIAAVMIDRGIANLLTLNAADFRRYGAVTTVGPSDV
jgi:hypothetical protein